MRVPLETDEQDEDDDTPKEEYLIRVFRLITIFEKE